MSDQYHYVYKFETSGGGYKPITLAIIDFYRDLLATFGGPGEDPIALGVELLCLSDTIITHSQFHFNVLAHEAARLGLAVIAPTQVDTAVLAKQVFGYQSNGLDVWARRLNRRRIWFKGNAVWCQQAADRCLRDAMMIMELYEKCLQRIGEAA